MDNMASVIAQMQAFGVEFEKKDLPLKVGRDKRKGCGKKGKFWYWLREFRPDAGGSFVVGRFGSYKSGESQKVEVDWKPLGEAERARMAAEEAAARKAADEERAREAELAALGALDLWRRADRLGESPYLKRKGVTPEACRYFSDGTVVIPLIRYDLPREEALRAVQRIKPDGAKFFTKGFAKPGCALRLGEFMPGAMNVVLVCEGYSTGLTIRMATGHQLVVYVALDAGNLAHVVPLVRELHPQHVILICADDDWRTRDHAGELNNPGRTAARTVAKQVTSCDFLWPVFDPATRKEKDTDFNDLHQRQGLDAVARQIRGVLKAMERFR
ncbi:MAG: toprim domain-containing protein [Burkholderiales bacterium]